MSELKLNWNTTKSQRLKRMRGLSFEELTVAPIVKIIDHPTRSGQVLLLFRVNDYVWVVPAIQETDGYFLKTLYPSRKATRELKEENNEKD